MKFITSFCLFIITACFYAHLSAEDGEKLILGFEREELRVHSQNFFGLINDSDDGIDVCAWFETDNEDLSKPTVGNRVWTWRLRPDQSSQGEYSLKSVIEPMSQDLRGKRKRVADFLNRISRSKVQRHHYPLRGIEYHEIFQTYQWLTAAPSKLRDWSGYEHLLIDIKLSVNAKIRLSIEDDFIEPAIVADYDVPAGSWVTLHLDLKRAVQERVLNLQEIINIQLMSQSKSPLSGDVYVDNIRIAKGSVQSDFTVITYDDSFLIAEPKQNTITPIQVPVNFHPVQSPIKMARPIKIDDGYISPYGWVTAVDNNCIFVSYLADGKTPRSIYTLDGGDTWNVAQQPAVRNIDHGTSRGWALDSWGDCAALSSGHGCVGLATASPRQILTKYTFTGTAWEARQPIILDSNIRHCGSSGSIMRLQSGPFKGRLWSAWGLIDRRRSLSIHAKYSDDDGHTWQKWGHGARIPGSRESDFSANTYSYQQPRLTPFNDHVACVWQDKRGLMWTFFDGANWSPVNVINSNARVELAATPSESFRAPGSVLTRGKNEIFVSAWGVNGVMRWDGKRWHQELSHACDAGTLSICGDQVFLFTTGSVPRLANKKRIKIFREAPVLCYRRDKTGTWHGPFNLSPNGEHRLLEYRQIISFTAPTYAPSNFIPIVWSNDNHLMMMRVPSDINASIPEDWQMVERTINPPEIDLYQSEFVPTIDGVIENAWRKSPLLEFKNVFGGGKPHEQTFAHVSRDDNMLYIAVECYDSKIDLTPLQKEAFDHPQLWKQDVIEVFLKPNDSENTYYQIMIAASGSVSDLSWKNGAKNIAWNSNVQSAVTVNSRRKTWTVELALPLKNFKLHEQHWGFNVVRSRKSKHMDIAEDSAWSPTGKRSSHVPDKFGVLKLHAK